MLFVLCSDLLRMEHVAGSSICWGAVEHVWIIWRHATGRGTPFTTAHNALPRLQRSASRLAGASSRHRQAAAGTGLYKAWAGRQNRTVADASDTVRNRIAPHTSLFGFSYHAYLSGMDNL